MGLHKRPSPQYLGVFLVRLHLPAPPGWQSSILRRSWVFTVPPHYGTAGPTVHGQHHWELCTAQDNVCLLLLPHPLHPTWVVWVFLQRAEEVPRGQGGRQLSLNPFSTSSLRRYRNEWWWRSTTVMWTQHVLGVLGFAAVAGGEPCSQPLGISPSDCAEGNRRSAVDSNSGPSPYFLFSDASFTLYSASWVVVQKNVNFLPRNHCYFLLPAR